jgi:hypothetical protein
MGMGDPVVDAQRAQLILSSVNKLSQMLELIIANGGADVSPTVLSWRPIIWRRSGDMSEAIVNFEADYLGSTDITRTGLRNIAVTRAVHLHVGDSMVWACSHIRGISHVVQQ